MDINAVRNGYPLRKKDVVGVELEIGNKMEKELKPNKCFCGANACVCEAGGHWRVHCEDCDWSFGGSTLEINSSMENVIIEWNLRTNQGK